VAVTAETVEPGPTLHDPETNGQHPPAPEPEDREDALAARLDRLEHELREEVVRQKQRADRAEAQLRALGDLDEQANDLVTEARAEASKVLEAARHEYEQAAEVRKEAQALLRQARSEAARLTREASLKPMAPAAPDRELLEGLKDHLIDTGALYAQLTVEAREAVIRLIQATGEARGKPALHEVSFDDDELDLEQAGR